VNNTKVSRRSGEREIKERSRLASLSLALASITPKVAAAAANARRSKAERSEA
jgi:hypothetical protein